MTYWVIVCCGKIEAGIVRRKILIFISKIVIRSKCGHGAEKIDSNQNGVFRHLKYTLK